jgi:hypothetical protein
MAKVVAIREVSHVECGPVFAGALASAALSFVVLIAAASPGLSLISAYPGPSRMPRPAAVAALWSLIVVIGSFLLGGYIAGRLRSSWREGGAEEVGFRDGIHGFLVWSVGIVLSAFLAFVAGLATAHMAAHATADAAAQGDSPLALATDTLLRTSPTAAITAPLEPNELRACSRSPSPTGV